MILVLGSFFPPDGVFQVDDQHLFYVDIRKAERELGWKPKIGVEKGVERLVEWVKENQSLFSG